MAAPGRVAPVDPPALLTLADRVPRVLAVTGAGLGRRRAVPTRGREAIQ